MTLALDSVRTGNMSINQVRNIRVSAQASLVTSHSFYISDKQVSAASKNKRALLWFLVMKIKTTI